MDIRIFCEGITDQKFIADFITKVYNIHFQDEKKKPLTSINGNCKIKIIEIGGCSNLHTQLWINELEKNTEQGFKNLIFFDADKEGNGNNGFSACVSKLSNLSSIALLFHIEPLLLIKYFKLHYLFLFILFNNFFKFFLRLISY